MEENTLKTCPFCREQIRTEAIKCRFCGEWLEVPSQPPVRVPDAIPLPSQPQPDAAPAPRKPSKISAHADSIPGGLPALKAWFKKHTKPESLIQIPPLLNHIRTPQTAEPQPADDAPPSVNANQRKVRIIAEVAIVIVLLFRGYIGWQKISKEPVGGNVTRTDIVLSWAQVSVINTIADIFLTPIGIGGVILLGYLYHNLRTRRSYPKKFHVRKAQGPPFLGPFTIEELRIECETGRIDRGWVAIEAKGHSYWSLKKIQNDQCLTVGSLLTTSHDMSIYILQNDETKGPYTVDQLRSMWRSSEITGDTLYCEEGYEAWLPLRGIVGQLESPPPIPQNSNKLSSGSESIGANPPAEKRLPKVFTFLSVGLLAICCLVLGLVLVQLGQSLHGQQREADIKKLAEMRARAEKGDAQSQFELGGAFYFGSLGVARDEVEAVKWYRKAAEQKIAIAQYALAHSYANGQGVVKDLVEAVKWYRKAAEENLAAAQNNMGVCCDNGQGVARDEVEAVTWYRKAAEQNLADAQYNLGACHYQGRGVKKDEVEALKWFRKAAEQDHANAQFNLGKCYANGEGVAKDAVEAVKWYRKAAEQNIAMAQNNLGACYANGEGVTKDAVEAVKWYRKAAEQNHVRSQLNLGACYEKGRGVARDEVEAVKWYRKAAEQNFADAQYNLGVCHYTGRGVGKDQVEAVKWFRRAAEQDHAEGQYNLGVCYAFGYGVGKDEVEAYKWWLLAGAQGNERANKNVAIFEKSLTGQQIGEGKRRAREFKPSAGVLAR